MERKSLIGLKWKQDGAALESSSSLQRIVRIFSCQEIGDWKFDIGNWTFDLRVWTLDIIV